MNHVTTISYNQLIAQVAMQYRPIKCIHGPHRLESSWRSHSLYHFKSIKYMRPALQYHPHEVNTCTLLAQVIIPKNFDNSFDIPSVMSHKLEDPRGISGYHENLRTNHR